MNLKEKLNKLFEEKNILLSETARSIEVGDPLTIYFAHPFDKWRSKREEMISRVLKERGFDVYNPFEKEDKLNVKYGVDNYYQKPTKSFAHDIVSVDLEAVVHCDCYFGWYPKDVAMIGTPLEMSWAFLFDKPITCLCYKPQPFLLEYADKLYVGYENFRKDIPHEWEE